MLSAQIGNSTAVGSPLTASAIPASISGQVINASTGLPVARALVRFNDRAALTDHDGKFQFEQNTQSSGNILIVKPGFYSTADPSDTPNLFVQSSQLSAPLRLLLYPEALFTGTLAALDGSPLSRIPVMALRSVFDDSGHHLVISAQTQTDSHGKFRLPVPAGSYRIETRYIPRYQNSGLAILPIALPTESSSDTSSVIRIHSGEEQHFELRPVTSRTYTVLATSESSQRGAGFARIFARSSNGGELQINPMPSGEPGETRMDLPQGTYTLRALRTTPEGPEQAETTITVPDHDISGVALRFAPIPSLPVDLQIDSAATSDNSQPSLQQLNLTLQNDQLNSDQTDSTVRLTTLSDHTFAFVAPPGSYHLQARGNAAWYVKSVGYGASDLLQQGLVVAPGSAGAPIRVLVSNQTGAVQGTVKLNGVLAPCWVYLIPTTPSAVSVISIRSNAEGAFSDTHLPPGSYLVIAFEHRFSANYRDPAALTAFANQVRSITINSGEKTTLDLDAVPGEELVP